MKLLPLHSLLLVYLVKCLLQRRSLAGMPIAGTVLSGLVNTNVTGAMRVFEPLRDGIGKSTRPTFRP